MPKPKKEGADGMGSTVHEVVVGCGCGCGRGGWFGQLHSSQQFSLKLLCLASVGMVDNQLKQPQLFMLVFFNVILFFKRMGNKVNEKATDLNNGFSSLINAHTHTHTYGTNASQIEKATRSRAESCFAVLKIEVFPLPSPSSAYFYPRIFLFSPSQSKTGEERRGAPEKISFS